MKTTQLHSSVTRSQAPHGRGLSAAARRTLTAVALGATFLSTHPAYAATDTWVGNASANFGTVNGFNVVPTSGDTLQFGPAGAAGTTLNNNLAAGFNIAALIFNLNASAYTIAGTNTPNLSGGIVDNALNAETLTVPLALTANQTFNVANMDGTLGVGAVSGAYALTKTGAGLLSLNSGTSFSNLVILGGTVQAGGDNNLGASGGSITLDGGTLRTNFGNNNFNYNIGSTRAVKLGDATAGTGGTIDTGGGNSTFAGILANNGGTDSFTKTGTGTLTLGNTSTYTGATNINQGTLNLDFNSYQSTTSFINSASTLVMGGPSTVLGTVADGNLPSLYVQGTSAGVRSQTFNGLTLNAGTSQIAARAVGGNNVTVALGAITHNAGGIAAFTTLRENSSGTGLGIITTTNTNDASGILGGWAVTNAANSNGSGFSTPTDYATVNGSGQIVAYSGYNTQAAGAVASNTLNNDRVTASGGVTLTVGSGTTDINTLSNASTATGTTTVNIASGGILRVGANGGFLTSASAGAITLSGGTLTAGGAANTAGTINLVGGNGGFTMGSAIADNGTGAVTVVASQFNNQTFGFNTASTYSGGTYLNEGRFQINNNTALGTGTVTVGSYAQAYLNASTIANNFNIIGASSGNNDTPSAIRFQGPNTLTGTVTLLGDATIGLRGGTGNFITGKITGNGNLTIGEGNGGGNITFSNTGNNFAGNLIINNEKVILGASNVLPDGAAAGNVSLNNGATLELNGFSDTINGLSGTTTVGQGTVQNTSSGASVLTVGANDQTSIFNGLITDSGAGKTLGITKTGAGLLTLGDAANAYVGGTTVNNGTLRLGAASGGTNSTLGKITGALAVNTGGTLDLGGFSQTVGALSGTGGVITDSSPTAATITFGDATPLTTFAGSIQDGTASGGGVVNVTKQNSGTTDLTGANTYTGATSITAGALQIGSGGSIAASSPVTLSGTGSLILGDATGAVSQTLNSLTTIAGTPVVGGASTASTLTLNGAGTVAYANAFGGSTATSQNLNLVIAGTGTTPTSTLSGTSTYTGTTTINSGSTLKLTGTLGNTAATINSGGTLSGTGTTAGTIAASGGSTISLTNGSGSLTAGATTLGSSTGSYGTGNYTTLTYTLGGTNSVEKLNLGSNALTVNSGGAYVNITNPNQPGTYTLASFLDSVAPTGFSLSSSTPGVTSVSFGRNTETLSDTVNSLILTVGGTPAPNVAYFNGAVSSVWNDITTSATLVNFSTNKAGTTDAGNTPAANTDVILNADNATANRGGGTSNLSETLGASTTINSLNVNNNGTTTIAADGSTLTINAAGDGNTDTGGGYTGNTAGTGINVMSGANAFTVNVPLVLGTTNAQSYTNNSANTFTVNGTVTGNSNADTLTLANTGAGATAVNGVVANGAGGTLALVVNNTGTGATTLSGANTYSGGTTLTAGALQLSGSGTLGSTSGTLTVNGGTLDLAGTSQAVGSLTGTGGAILNSVAGAQTLTVGTGNATGGTYSGVIEDNAGTGGTLAVTKTGTGTETLSGADAYSGGTTVNQGTLTSAVPGGFGTGFVTVNPTGATASANDNATLNTTGSIASTAAVTVNSEASDGGFGIGTINFNGTAPTIGSLTGNGKVVLNNASGTALTVGNASSTTFSGVISNGAGTGSLTKAGTGTLTLTGANTYTGGTTVNAGTLATTDDVNAFGTNGASTTVAIGSAGTVLINSNTNNTYSDTFSGSGLLKFAFPGGGSDTIVNNFNNFTGTIEVGSANGGGNKLQIQSNVLTNLAGSTLQIDNGGQFFTGGDVNFGTINIIGTGNNEGRGAIRLNGNGTTSGVIGGNVVLQGNTTIGNEGGVLTGNISTGVAGTSTLTMGTGNSGGSALLSGNISNGVGTLALNQSNGTTTLSGANTYTGATTVSGGTLSLTGSLTGSNVSTSGGGLVSESATGVIGGTGTTFTQGSSGTSILAGANTYTGGTTVTAGTLKTTGAGTLGATTSGLTVNGGTLDLSGTSQTVANLSGTGGIILNSAATTASTLTFGSDNAANTFSGTIEDNSGTGGTLAIVKQGTGVESLGGTISNTGGFTVGNGVAYLTNGNNPGAGALTFGTAGAANNTALVFSQNGRTFSNAITTQGTGGTNTIQSQGGGQGFTFSGPVTLGNNLTFRTVGGSDSLNETGAITGTGNLETNVSTTSVNTATSASGTGGTITLSGSVNNVGMITNDGTGSAATFINGVIGPNVTGVIENSATSALYLNNTNTYGANGGLTVTNGTVYDTNNNTYLTDAAGDGTVTLGATGAANTATIQVSNIGRTFANAIATQGTGGTNTIQTSGGGQTFTFSGPVTDNGGLTLNTINGSDSINETGAITGNGGLTTTNASTGTTTLAGSVNNAGTITNNGTGTGATTISGVIGSNVTGVAQNSTTSALILTRNDTIGGSLSAVSGAALSLASGAINTVSGTGLTLAGDALTFDILGGTADSIAVSGLASVTGANTINLNTLGNLTGGTITLISAAGGLGSNAADPFSLVTPTGFNTGSYTYSLNDTGTLLQLIETPTLVTDAPQAYFTGNTSNDLNASGNFVTTPAGGTQATIGADSNVFFSANTAHSAAATTISAPTTINSLTLGVGAAAGTPVGISGSTLTISAAGTGGNTMGVGVTDSNTGVTDTIGSNVALGAANETVGVANAGNTLAITGSVSGTGDTLTKTGGGTLVLANNNAYGGTTISAGTLQIGNGGSTGSLGSGAVTDNGVLALDVSGSMTVGNTITGTGSLTATDPGSTTTLSGTGNSYSGGTTVSGAGTTLKLNSAGADGTGTVTITGDGTANGATSTKVVVSSLGGSALGGGGTTLTGGELQNGNPSGATSAAGETPQSNNVQSGGLLTLTSGTTSYLDFGAGNTGAVFSFSGLSGGGTLDILDWNGNFSDSTGTAGGDGLDQLFIGNSKTLTAAQLAQFVFVSPDGAGGNSGGAGNAPVVQLADGELAPTPEPSQVGMLALMAAGLGGLLLRARKRKASEISK